MGERWRLQLARVAAPAAFLLAATVAVVLVRSALEADEPVPAARTTGTSAPATTRPATTVTLTATTGSAPTTTGPLAEFYVIESGDTLATIAETYGTSVEELLELNPGVDPTTLSVGQRIRVE